MSDATMTTDMRPAAKPAPPIPGDPGGWILIIGEMTVFTVLFTLVGYHHVKDPNLFATDQRELTQVLGLTNTVVLLTSSILVVLATRAAAGARYEIGSRLVAVAMGCGLLFACIKALEYSSLLHNGVSLHTDKFWTLYFVITAIHLVHVAVGVAGLALLGRRIKLGLPGHLDADLFKTGGSYWHMVDLIWLIIFPLFYLVN